MVNVSNEAESSLSRSNLSLTSGENLITSNNKTIGVHVWQNPYAGFSLAVSGRLRRDRECAAKASIGSAALELESRGK